MRRLMGYILACLILCVGRTTLAAENEAIKAAHAALAEDPSNPALLRVFQRCIKPGQESTTSYYLAVLYLGALSHDNPRSAEASMKMLARAYPSSPYIQRLAFKNLAGPCATCAGSGGQKIACGECRGAATCSLCGGSGLYATGMGATENKRRRGLQPRKTACPGCARSGTCPSCKGRGKVVKACDACKGEKRVLDRSRAEEWFHHYLKQDLVTIEAGPVPPL